MNEATVNAKALQVLERGIKALQKQNYGQAANAFKSLLEKFPGEHALCDHAREYLQACERMTATTPKAPTDGRDLLDLATWHLNRGELEEARPLLDKAEKKPGQEWETAYTYAVYHALLGEEEEALERLSRAIELNETCKYTARGESDFALLQESPRFRELVN